MEIGYIRCCSNIDCLHALQGLMAHLGGSAKPTILTSLSLSSVGLSSCANLQSPAEARSHEGPLVQTTGSPLELQGNVCTRELTGTQQKKKEERRGDSMAGGNIRDIIII